MQNIHYQKSKTDNVIFHVSHEISLLSSKAKRVKAISLSLQANLLCQLLKQSENEKEKHQHPLIWSKASLMSFLLHRLQQCTCAVGMVVINRITETLNTAVEIV